MIPLARISVATDVNKILPSQLNALPESRLELKYIMKSFEIEDHTTK